MGQPVKSRKFGWGGGGWGSEPWGGIRAFAQKNGRPAIVRGSSMLPEFQDGDKILVVSGIRPQREATAALRFPWLPIEDLFIKRIWGLPGDKIEIIDGNRIKITGKDGSKTLPNKRTLLQNGDTEEEPVVLTGAGLNILRLFANKLGMLPPDGFILFGDQPGGMDSSRFGVIGGGKIVGLVHRGLV